MFPDTIEQWHTHARPNPLTADFNVQLGCHFEEIAEMLATLKSVDSRACDLLDGAHTAITYLAIVLKQGRYQVQITDRKEFLDSLCDQVVTAIGTGYCAGMKTTEGLRRVNNSNWSKFDMDGNPLRDNNGKIKKGPNYLPPVLDGLY